MSEQALPHMRAQGMGLVVPQMQAHVRGVDGDWLEAFLAARGRERRRGRSGVRKPVSRNTLLANRRDVEVFARWYADFTGREFTPDQMDGWTLGQYQAWTRGVAKKSAGTWNRYVASLSVFVEWAQAAGYLAGEVDPLECIYQVKEVKKAPRWLGNGEFHDLMRALEQGVHGANTVLRKEQALETRAMAALMVFAGLRVGEVVGLELDDIQLREKGEKGREGKGCVRVRSGKGDKDAEVQLNTDAARMVRPWVELCRQRGKMRLFELTTRAVEVRFAELGREAGVEDLTPHRLRHTCCKRMVDAGVPLSTVRVIMRHEKIETTAAYAEPGEEDLQEAVEKVSQGKMARRGV